VIDVKNITLRSRFVWFGRLVSSESAVAAQRQRGTDDAAGHFRAHWREWELTS
jgi:hypothetical protein